VEDVHFTEVLNRSELVKSVKWGGSTLVAILICVLIWQAPLFESVLRLLHPLKDYSVLSKFEYHISPGNATVVKGENIELAAQIIKKSGPDHAKLLLKKKTTQLANELLLTREENNRKRFRLTRICVPF
jgi:hypothetical protein